MASHIVSAKISIELHEQLLEKAALQNKSLSEAVRDAIQDWVSNNQKPLGEAHSDITEQLKQMEITVEAALRAVGSVMGAALKESAKARVFARLSTSYAIDMTQFLTKNKVFDRQDKETAMHKFDEEAENDSEKLWNTATNFSAGQEN